ncbi:MAG: sensor histidine kinase [Planctomycetota bacterium]|nr:MAG: sensor histidine kinase [Planctomycetota bacterium]
MRRWWWMFGAGAAALLAVLVWVSLLVLELERAEFAARDHAAQQERLRLALWRMDSWLAPRLAREAARPYFEYSSYYPQERAYTRMLQPLDKGEVLTASPLLTFGSEVFPLHFQVGPDGVFGSPQGPEGNQLELALQTCIGPDMAQTNSSRLEQLATRVGYDELLAASARSEGRLAQPVAEQEAPPPPPPSNAPPADDATRSSSGRKQQTFKNRQELGKRAKTAQQAISNTLQPSALADLSAATKSALDAARGRVVVGPLVPIWFDDGRELLFARRVQVAGRTLVQGLTVDWPVLRDALLAEITDLLPLASLRARGDADIGGLELATVPALLVTPEPPSSGPSGMTPARWTLALGWMAALLAAGAAGHSVRATLELGERRSRFATAVTHELRTPLTTFRMYSEMLAEGMVSDETARSEYLHTLRDESERLSRLVENVLEYARLEEGRTAPRATQQSVGELLESLRPDLERRALAAGMQLCIETNDATETAVSCDPTLVGQVLFNLVDNAAKYAADASDRRVHLRAQVSGANLHLTVRDHGPGIPANARRAVFRPFERRGPDAVPGVGLGLALCRGLARRLGGDLDLDDTGGQGASFRLVLPLMTAG